MSLLQSILAPNATKKARRYDKNTARMKAQLPYHKAGVASTGKYGVNPIGRQKKAPKLTKPRRLA